MGRSKTQISDSIIRNPDVSPVEFVILLRLKHLYYLNGNKKRIEFDMNKFKYNVCVNDNRTIKRHFKGLYEKGYISNEIVIKRKSPVEVVLNIKKLTEKPFTQLPASLLKNIDCVGHAGIKLLYYYESYITRGSTVKQFCYASIDTISKHVGINKKTVYKHNELLSKNKLVHIEKHGLGTDYSYNENDELVYDKFHNHYSVLHENI